MRRYCPFGSLNEEWLTFLEGLGYLVCLEAGVTSYVGPGVTCVLGFVMLPGRRRRHVRRVRRACKLGKGEWKGIQRISPLRPKTHTQLLETKKIRKRGAVGSFLQVCDLAKFDGVCQDGASFQSCDMASRSLMGSKSRDMTGGGFWWPLPPRQWMAEKTAKYDCSA